MPGQDASHPSGPYEYFALATESLALLPLGQQLVIDHHMEIALVVDWNEKQILRACTAFADELALLCPLLRAWPAPVSYDRLVAALNPKLGDVLAQRVQAAIADGDDLELLALLEEVQDCLDCLLERLKPLGFTILPAENRRGLVVATVVEGMSHANV